MAVEEGSVWGHRELIDRLLVPRQLTRMLLLAVGFAMSAAAWHFFPKGILVYGSGITSSFCLLVAGAVWALRDRLDDVLEDVQCTAAEYALLMENASRQRRRFVRRAGRVAICALVAASAAVSDQLTKTVWHWMVLGGGLAVGEAVYSYMLANSWDEQIRAMRSKKQFEARRKAEIDQLVERLSKPAATPSQPADDWAHSDSWSRPH